ncbi:MAG: hypothetical protein WCF20_08200 [Methylovirgula sp.]
MATIPGCEVFCGLAPERRPLPRTCALLFELERLIYGLKGDSAIDPLGALTDVAANTLGGSETHFDIVVDFAGSGGALPACDRVLTLCFNAIPGEIGLIAALMSQQPLLVEVHDTARRGEPWTARPATVDRDIIARSVDNVLSCTARLIVKVINAPAPFASRSGGQPCPRAAPASAPVAFAAALHATGAVARKTIRLIGMLAKGGKSWAVAWRFDHSLTLLDKQSAVFSKMADDGCRYYADPFPFRHNGRTFVFVEEFPYATARGCISVIELDEHGGALLSHVVLEEPYHLSYPFVFEHEGEIWMIPESGEGKGVYLYRAEPFPYKWRREACLVSDIEAYDSTLLRHDGRFWLFVCEREWKSSSWDTLSLFHAESLTGQWRPHSQNPVLLDATLSRPAGAIFNHNGHDLRPVQDCSRQYGGAVVLCSLDALGQDAFAQTVVGQIHCGPHGCHTYNACAGFEVMDVFGPTRRLRDVTAFYTPAR